MTDPTVDGVRQALTTVLTELIDGSPREPCWVLNVGDPGLLRSLDELSAAAASAVPPQGAASIAAHVDHLRYGLHLLNRWSRGEEPFADADWGASWRRIVVSDREWTELREGLRAEARAWQEVVRTPRDVSRVELTGLVAGVAHLAYHLGAIRQIDRSIAGPAARD